LCLALSSSGCVAAGLYTTPDTLAPGKVQAVGAFEAWQLTRNVGRPAGALFGDRHEGAEGFSIIPAGIVHVGVADGLEAGLGFARADVKVRLARTDPVGVAIDPVARYVVTPDGGGEVVELPLVVGVKAADCATIVANLGGSYLRFPTAEAAEAWETTFAVRAGLGVRIRVHRLVALQPEITYIRSVQGAGVDWLSGGLAVDVGGIP
jgi:hypothetical protein